NRRAENKCDYRGFVKGVEFGSFVDGCSLYGCGVPLFELVLVVFWHMKMLGLAWISGSGLRNEALTVMCSEERTYWFRLTFAFHFIGVSAAEFCQVDRVCTEAEI
ncbi:MAG: hypothetical protein WA389_00090, partial [Terriglobales bacterium]